MIKRFFILLLAIVASVGMSWATTTDLASITDNYTAQDGEILTGTLGVNVKISIADGATVTLLNANINGDKTWTTGEYAGLTCLGDATITIVGKNSVSGFYADELGNGYPGIYVPSDKTLIINGTGSLTAQSSTEEAAGIGARKNTHCGNIEIQSGKITAIASGEYGAGIGGAYNASCGDITISGGIVTAVGGDHCAGIGGGRRGASTNAGHCGNILISGGVVSATSGKHAAAIGGGRGNNNNYKTNCGTISITNTALKVYAEQGGDKGSTNTIGAAKYGNCGAVEIGGNTGVINDDPYTYRTKEDGEIVVDYINAIGTVVYTQECKDKIDIARELYDALEDSQKALVTNYQTLLDAEAAYAALIPQPAADPIPCTAEDLGKVLCTDGSIYATVSEATAASKTAAAVIAYVDTENGKALALALADESGTMEWATAKTTAPAHTPAVSGGTWTLASKDDWNNMITAAGGYEALRDGFSAVGGTNMQQDKYWSSTPENDYAWCYYFNYGKWVDGYVDNPCRVRACLAFDIPAAPAAPAYETVMNLINEIPNPVVLTAECKAKIDAARAAFIALSDGDKAQVTNIATLTTAEAAFENVMNIWLSGDCDAILWKDTTLTIRKHAGEGNGAMADYTSYYGSNTAPWYNSHWYNPQPGDIVIKSVTIEEGVTRIGKNAFGWMSELKTVTIPSSMTSIGEDAFYWSKAVDDIYLTVADPSNLTWALPYSADNQFKPNKGTNCHVPSDLLEAYQAKFTEINVTFVGDLAPVDPAAGAAAIVDLINAIGTVEYTDECKAKIDAAREAYDKAVDAVKDLISADDLKKLTDAETEYADLKAAADQTAADPVIALINELPNPMTEADLKLSVYTKVQDARAAFDALTADQKLLVTNLAVLEAAEAAFAPYVGGGGAPLPDGALSGAFSINASGGKIVFSKGNLQYVGSWQFATNQWDAFATDQSDDHRDLFGWGTKNNPNNVSTENSDYTWAEWGENAISNGGDQANAGWRTLTNDEWTFLLNTRSAATRFAKAYLFGTTHGLILFPDNYSHPAGLAEIAGINSTASASWNGNQYSAADWTKMEAAGAVFLPLTGYRSGTSISEETEAGEYWTSTPSPSNTEFSYYLYFSDAYLSTYTYGNRVGNAVRLVISADAAGGSVIDDAKAAVDLINAIPDPVTLEDACVKAIKDARAAVDALGENAKLIDAADMAKLTDAEAALTALNQAEADEVIAKINNIPQPVELKLATRDSIESARAAYDALTADQQALVTNYQTLLDAEAALAALNPGGGMPAGALSGKFTINADGDQIAFSKGNLQATTTDLGTTWTWGFAANQWEVIGNAAANNAVNGNRTVSANGTVDLFGWSTPTTYYGIHNSTNSDYYSDDFREWGENITGATWKTLSPSDWIYIISNRADAAQKQGQATVNGVNGYIFLPDEWEIPTGLSFTAKPNNWTANVYEGDDWTAMENAGAVFLPKSSWRKGNTVSSLAYGYYWSSDYNNYSNAMAYYFGENLTITGTGIPRYAGIYVRLVTADAGSPSPLDSAQAVKDLIDAIPVPVTLDSKDEIDAARDAYDALADLTKGALDNATVTKLTDAEDAYAALIKEATDVIALINAIPQPVVYNEACGDSIAAAREAYDALSDELKPLVTNYPVLTDAEATYEALAPRIWTSGDCQVIYWPGDSAMIVSKLPGEGNGVMDNYANKKSVPWVDYQLKVKTLTIESGVTEIGSCAFYELRNLEGGLVIPEGVTAIHENGFRNCRKLTSITLPSTITLLGDNADAFNNCTAANIYITADPNKLAWNEDFDDFIYSYSQPDVHKTTVCHVPVDFYEIYVAKFDQTVNVTFVGDLPAALSPAEHAAIEAVKDSIAAIGAEISYPESGAEIDAARSAYDALDDDLKPFVSNYQTLLDAEDAYADAKQAHDAVAAAVVDKINAIPVPVEYSSKPAIDTARVAYDALLDTQKALVPDSILQKLIDAEAAWAAIAAKVEHNVTYIGKDGELKNEKVALLHIPDPVPDVNGFEFARWDVMSTELYNEGIRIKAIYSPIITVNPAPYDTLVYNGMAQTLITAAEAKEGHVEYCIVEGAWSAELPQATNAGSYPILYKLVREGYEDYIAPDTIIAVIAKAPVTYIAPVAYDTLVYNYAAQELVIAGQTEDGTFAYTFTPNDENSWSAALPQGTNAGTYDVYFRINGDANHLDSVAPAPVTASIAKRDIVVTAPVAYDTLVYNAEAQTLAADGTADFGTLRYTLTPNDSQSWKTTMAKGTNAGSYTVYYCVEGDKNHNNFAPESIEVTIAKAPLTITANDTSIIYADSIPEFTASYSGWQGQDDETVVSNLAFSCAYQQGSYIGTYAINPNSATAHNYAITFVDGTLTVNKAHVYVSDAEAQIAKFADGHANAVVLEQGVLNGIKLNDPIAHLTTAAFSTAEVGEQLTITLFYELTGDATLLNNYNLTPTEEVFTNEAVIIEPFLPDNDGKPEDQEAEVKEGIEVYAYGYCDGSGYSLKYHLNSGYPDQYKIEFADSRFDNVDYTETAISGRDGEIYIEIPAEMPTGDYTMTVTFRDSRFDWLESQPFTVTFHVNLPETYVQPLFNNTIVLIDTCECFTDIQWYYRANSTELWQPIAGATGHYYHVDGELKGEYFVAAKVNGMPTFTCGQADMETLYGETKLMKVKAFPNPVVTATTVTVENAENNDHTLRVVNLMGVEVMKTTFEGNETVVDMSACTSGNYMITVDGIVVKVMKK